MAMPTALTPPIVTLRRELRVARQTYESIASQRVADDAPIEDQHRYWRLHDTSKELYARLDWQYQKRLIQGGFLAAALSAPFTVQVTATPFAVAMLFVFWRMFVVLRRMAPGDD